MKETTKQKIKDGRFIYENFKYINAQRFYDGELLTARRMNLILAKIIKEMRK